jgi:hypothetical protein
MRGVVARIGWVPVGSGSGLLVLTGCKLLRVGLAAKRFPKVFLATSA